MLIGTLEDVANFYTTVARAIDGGELDAQILKL